MRWYSRRGGNVMRWQFGKGERVVSREGGMEFKDKIVLFCSREATCMQGFTAGFDNSYIMVWIIVIKWASVA